MKAEQLKQRIREHIATKLKCQPTQIPENQPFAEMGIDSMVAIELTYELEVEMGRYVSPGALFEFDTIEKMAKYLTETSQPRDD